MANCSKTIIRIVGGGPAGSAAAIAAQTYGARTQIIERSQRPRHKVCGEFISAEACEVIEELGAWDSFVKIGPARITRCSLRFGSREKIWKLAEPAQGLSRLELDRLLLERAKACGAEISSGEQAPDPRHEFQACQEGSRVVLATGRASVASKPTRLFGFKSHFAGPTDDMVRLFFASGCYVGVSSVENGITNVCGIAPESVLRRYDFCFDDFVFSFENLSDRLKPLTRCMRWLSTGPLVFSRLHRTQSAVREYAAGDAFGFIDPFSGSGILHALLTGRMAGNSAAAGLEPAACARLCGSSVQRAFLVSSVLRTILEWECAGFLAAMIPGDWIYGLTRATIRG